RPPPPGPPGPPPFRASTPARRPPRAPATARSAPPCPAAPPARRPSPHRPCAGPRLACPRGPPSAAPSSPTDPPSAEAPPCHLHDRLAIVQDAAPTARIEVLMRWLAALLVLLSATAARADDAVSFGLDWLAEAEYGGYYQALATGIYQRHGLAV